MNRNELEHIHKCIYNDDDYLKIIRHPIQPLGSTPNQNIKSFTRYNFRRVNTKKYGGPHFWKLLWTPMQQINENSRNSELLFIILLITEYSFNTFLQRNSCEITAIALSDQISHIDLSNKEKVRSHRLWLISQVNVDPYTLCACLSY